MRTSLAPDEIGSGQLRLASGVASRPPKTVAYGPRTQLLPTPTGRALMSVASASVGKAVETEVGVGDATWVMTEAPLVTGTDGLGVAGGPWALSAASALPIARTATRTMAAA